MEKPTACEQACSSRTRREMCRLQSKAKKLSENLKMLSPNVSRKTEKNMKNQTKKKFQMFRKYIMYFCSLDVMFLQRELHLHIHKSKHKTQTPKKNLQMQLSFYNFPGLFPSRLSVVVQHRQQTEGDSTFWSTCFPAVALATQHHTTVGSCCAGCLGFDAICCN